MKNMENIDISTQEPEMDEFEKQLESTLVLLKNCQSDNSLNSCMPCDKFFECELRKKYVLDVHMSMNKNKSGGFEF